MFPSAVDPAILQALGLDAASSKMAPHGGSGFASSFKLTGMTKDGEDRTFFVKTGTGPDADTMFRGEHASLNAIHAAVPSLNLCPRSHAHGALSSSPNKYFLATDFLDLAANSSSSSKGSGLSLAGKLAQLHTTPAPIPSGHTSPQFGFPVSTCCGATEQDNSFNSSWADFYANSRLRGVLRSGIRNNGADAELSRTVETVASKVVPRLLGDGHLNGVVPVVVHGDLWSGNHGWGRIVSSGEGESEKGAAGGVEEVVYDPSCVYGHSEYELGIMRMFGGFGKEFWSEYGRLVKKAEPEEEWEDRVSLYELYHHLNHFSLFGGGYRSGAMSIMKRLINKYGKD